MRLESLSRRPRECRQYLERYVNDGSPSGFTELNRTSANTDPFGLTPWFHLYLLSGPVEWFIRRGNIPSWIDSTVDNSHAWIFVHPDMADSPSLRHPLLSVQMYDRLRVVPTSSARTVQILDRRSADYVKLHYARLLGRIDRSMPFNKALAGIETSLILEQAVHGRKLNDQFWFLPEIGTSVAFLPGADSPDEWGMVWRSEKPVGANAESIAFMIPFFSLFSVDRLSSYDPPLLCAITEANGAEPKEFLLTKIIRPLICSYVQLVSVLGLQPEWNAQNILLALNGNFEVLGIVMRDLTDLEKDLTMRRALGLQCELESFPYKCISAEDGEIYRIRHSFAFDFKLGEYVLEPLAYIVSQEYGYHIGQLRDSIRYVAEEFLAVLPPDFFPTDGLYYKHDRIELTGARPYVTGGKPKFRSSGSATNER